MKLKNNDNNELNKLGKALSTGWMSLTSMVAYCYNINFYIIQLI